MFYCNSFVRQTGLRYSVAVMQLHPALDLLQHGPVRQGVRVLQLPLAVQGDCWGWCKNRSRFMPPTTTERGLLGQFPPGADLPIADQLALTLFV